MSSFWDKAWYTVMFIIVMATVVAYVALCIMAVRGALGV